MADVLGSSPAKYAATPGWPSSGQFEDHFGRLPDHGTYQGGRDVVSGPSGWAQSACVRRLDGGVLRTERGKGSHALGARVLRLGLWFVYNGKET